MQIKKLTTFEENRLVKEHNRVIKYLSSFNFLNGHKGVRENCLHGLIGTMGSGKSSLMKKISADCAASVKVLNWLSEEDTPQYSEKIHLLCDSDFQRNNLMFFEEKSIPKSTRGDLDKFLEYFKQVVIESDAEVVFIDNVTSSMLYNDSIGPWGQGKVALWLSEFVKDVCEVFYLAHTKKEITDNYHRPFTSEDIRGSSQLPMWTEYLYMFQKYQHGEEQFNFINNTKHRFHEDAGGFYLLEYLNGGYRADIGVGFDRIKGIFKDRNKF